VNQYRAECSGNKTLAALLTICHGAAKSVLIGESHGGRTPVLPGEAQNVGDNSAGLKWQKSAEMPLLEKTTVLHGGFVS